MLQICAWKDTPQERKWNKKKMQWWGKKKKTRKGEMENTEKIDERNICISFPCGTRAPLATWGDSSKLNMSPVLNTAKEMLSHFPFEEARALKRLRLNTLAKSVVVEWRYIQVDPATKSIISPLLEDTLLSSGCNPCPHGVCSPWRVNTGLLVWLGSDKVAPLKSTTPLDPGVQCCPI